MKKYLVTLAVVFFFLLVAATVEAGGCCFLSFSATSGIAGDKPAHVRVSFTDPNNTYMDESATTLRPLTGQKIVIHIVSPKAGQSCTITSSDITNADGAIEADCVSKTSGDMSIYFSAPNMDSASSQAVSQTSQKVYFEKNASAPEPTTAPVVSPAKKPEPTPTVIVEPTTAQTSTETSQLQEKVEELEKKLNEQQEEVNSLKALLDSILGFFNKLFN